MTLDETYAVRGVPPGSARYWSWHFASPESRDALLGVYALMAEWDGLIAPGREPSVSLGKLVWWHEEMERFAAGAPMHPITRFIAHSSNTDDRRDALLGQAFAALEAHRENRDAPLLWLAGRAGLSGAARDTAAVRDFCEQLAAALNDSRRASATLEQHTAVCARLQCLAQPLAAPLRGPLRGLIVLANLCAQTLLQPQGDRTISVWCAWRAARASARGKA